MTARIALCITELEPAARAHAGRAGPAARSDAIRTRCLFSRLASAGQPPDSADELAAAGVESHYLERGPRAPAGTLLRLTALLRAHQPDLVQTFLFHANVLGAWAARRAAAAGWWPASVWPSGSGPGTAGWLGDTRTGVDRHVCVSRDVEQFANRVTGLAAGSLVVIPNGVDRERSGGPASRSRASLGLPQAGVRGLRRPARASEGIDWLLDLMPAICAAASHDLMVVGEGREPAALDRKRSRWGLPVECISPASEPTYQPFGGQRPAGFALAVEGMPNVLLEAMAAGRPVVAIRAEGIAEVLGPAVEEQSAAQGDSQAFIDKSVAILGQPNWQPVWRETSAGRARNSRSSGWWQPMSNFTNRSYRVAGNFFLALRLDQLGWRFNVIRAPEQHGGCAALKKTMLDAWSEADMSGPCGDKWGPVVDSRMLLTGTFSRSIDEKLRIAIPSLFEIEWPSPLMIACSWRPAPTDH